MYKKFIKREYNCPNRANHTPDVPQGYMQFYEWADNMRKTHTQTQCWGCGLWLIWEPKEVMLDNE